MTSVSVVTCDTYREYFEQGTLSGEFFSAAVARWGIFFLLPLPFLKSVAKCHVSQKSEPGDCGGVARQLRGLQRRRTAAPGGLLGPWKRRAADPPSPRWK